MTYKSIAEKVGVTKSSVGHFLSKHRKTLRYNPSVIENLPEGITIIPASHECLDKTKANELLELIKVSAEAIVAGNTPKGLLNIGKAIGVLAYAINSDVFSLSEEATWKDLSASGINLTDTAGADG